jgi:hypothetical protein
MLRRIFIILAILASIGVIVVSQTKLKEHVTSIRDQRQDFSNKLSSTTATLNSTKKTLATTSNELVSTKEKLASTTTKLQNTEKELAAVTGVKERLDQDLTKMRAAEKAARDELAQWSNLGIKAEMVKVMQDDLTKSKDTIVVMEEEKKMLTRKIAKLTNELARLIDPNTYTVQLPPGLKGSVLVVDPKWEFVVLNIGEKNGVLKDGVMMVHRDTKLIGKVKIATVMPDRCIANILPGWKVDEIMEGDGVMFPRQ